MKIKYIGAKYGMPIMSPVGQRPTFRSKIFAIVDPGEEVELSEKEATELAALDPINFMISSGKSEQPKEQLKEEPTEQPEVLEGVIAEPEKVEQTLKKRRGRPRKIKLEG